MNDIQIVLSVLTGIALFIYIGLHLQALPYIRTYNELYNLMVNNTYRYQPNTSNSSIFRRYVYDRTLMVHRPISDHIIFFPDGDIKLNDNLYIWKSTMVGNLIRWYYHRKFCRLKDKLISDYNFNQAYRRMSSYDGRRHYFVKNENKLNFKFFEVN
jgi:hypothetical protein